MKVWITRPDSGEVFMGGMRSVLLWVAKPTFDHRPMTQEFELVDPDSQKCMATIWREGGWTSEAGRVKAKPFLKQNKDLLNKIWREIYTSTLPPGPIDPDHECMTFEHSQDMMNFDYELRCRTHWKRFLLEVDIKTENVEIVIPKTFGLDSEADPSAIDPDFALTSLFYDEDLHRPFHYRVDVPFEQCTKNIW
jgi:hypothetical protein